MPSLPIICVFCLFALGQVFSHADSPALADIQPYTRIIETDAKHYRLEAAWRRFEAPGKPPVWLVGMVHDGSPDYFLTVQAFLNQQPLVLLEDDNSEITEPPDASATDAQRKAWTKIALKFLGELVEGYHQEYKDYPASFDSLFFTLEPTSAWAMDLRTCINDGWGHPFSYRMTKTGFEIKSAGDTPQPDPDLTVTNTENWQWTNLDESRSGNADSLGLLDQSNGGIDFNHPNFYFCDMLAAEYDRRVAALPKNELDQPESPLRKTLDKKYHDDVQVQRFIILETAGTPHIAEVLDPKGEDHVTLRERNDVVWAELLRRFNASTPITVLYGAAHMYDLQRRLTTQAGYVLTETRWTPVFDVDLTGSKITKAEIAGLKDDAKAGRMGFY